MNVILPPLAAAIDVALIGLAGDGDVGVFVILVAWCRVAWCRVAWCFVLRLVAGSFVLRPVASSGSDGQDSGDDKLLTILHLLLNQASNTFSTSVTV